MSRVSFVPLLVLAFVLAGCRGTVPVRGEVVLPAGAVVPAGARLEVTLARVDAPGGAPRAVARVVRDTLGAAPWSIALDVPADSLARAARLSVSARVSHDGRSLFAGTAAPTPRRDAPVRVTLAALRAASWDERPVAVERVEARIAAARARGAAFAAVSGDTALGDSRSRWIAHLDGDEPVLIEEAVAPDGGGHSTFTYAFAGGRLAAFRERGERVGLLPGRPSTFARVDVDVAFEPEGEPLISHRIEGLPAQPESTLPAQVLARVSKLVAFARAKAGS